MTRIREGIKHVAQEVRHTPPRSIVERQLQKIPADTFIVAAAVSVGLSLMLRIIGRKSDSEFVGEWAPTMVGLAIYDKLTKGGGEETQDFPSV